MKLLDKPQPDIGTVIDVKLDMVRVKAQSGKTGFYHDSILNKDFEAKDFWVMRMKNRPNFMQDRGGGGGDRFGKQGLRTPGVPKAAIVRKSVDVEIASPSPSRGASPSPGRGPPKKEVIKEFVTFEGTQIPGFWDVADPMVISNEWARKAWYLLAAIDDWIGLRGMRPRKLFWIFRNPLTHEEFHAGLKFIALINLPEGIDELSKIIGAMHAKMEGEVDLNLFDLLVRKVRQRKVRTRKERANLFIRQVNWTSWSLDKLPTPVEKDAQDFLRRTCYALSFLQLCIAVYRTLCNFREICRLSDGSRPYSE